MQIGDKVLVFTHHNGTPTWIAGKIRNFMNEVGYIGVTIRPDYRKTVSEAFHTIVPKEFVFTDFTGADQWVQTIQKRLDATLRGHDTDEKAWDMPEVKPLSTASPLIEQAESPR